ncbi:Ribonuclease H [Spathaspora sp. JA1]|nr:Ribonuclease H [Spathaspora sp. JA1]
MIRFRPADDDGATYVRIPGIRLCYNVEEASRGITDSFYHYESSSDDEPQIHFQDVYIDGACRGNGVHATPAAGVGIYYGPDDSRNEAIGLHTLEQSPKPTNQRAELHAVARAVREIQSSLYKDSTCKTNIHTDSQYVIGCMEKWVDKWRRNGWRNTKGAPVANADIIKKAVDVLDNINSIYSRRGWSNLNFHFVPGHSGNHGNEQADKLANIGADKMKKYLKRKKKNQS